MCAHDSGTYAVALCDFVEDVANEDALHTRVAFATDFLFVSEDGEDCLVGFGLDSRRDFGIRAHSVVVTVSADERSVKADVVRLCDRNGLDFRGEEVFLRYAVFFIENFQHSEFDRVLFFASCRDTADEDVEVFRREAVRNSLDDLLLREVREKVGDVEVWIALFLAYANIDVFAVFERHDAVKCERNREPLILLYTAVVVRLEESHVRLLIERDLLQVKARAVDVSDEDSDAVLCDVRRACFENKETFSAVVVIEFVARVYFVAEVILFVSARFYECDA